MEEKNRAVRVFPSLSSTQKEFKVPAVGPLVEPMSEYFAANFLWVSFSASSFFFSLNKHSRFRFPVSVNKKMWKAKKMTT